MAEQAKENKLQFAELLDKVKTSNASVENFGDMRKVLDLSVEGFKNSEKSFKKLDVISKKFSETVGKETDNPVVLKIQEQIDEMRKLDGGDRKEQLAGLRKLGAVESLLKDLRSSDDERAKKTLPLIEEQVNLLKSGLKTQSSLLTKSQKLFTDKIDDFGGVVAGFWEILLSLDL